jgi:hypothetical protein
MIQSLRKKQFHPVTAACLALAVSGLLFFSKVELPHVFETGRAPYSTGVFTPFDHTIYWLAEETGVAGKAKKNSASAMWNGAPRVIIPAGIHSAAEYHSAISIFLTDYNYFPNINNAIPLRLRV